MSKIKRIEIKNFKFFNHNVPPIELNGKHALIYGENGSGKSSIFWALYTLLEASLKDKDRTEKYFLDPHNPDNEFSLVNLDATPTVLPDGKQDFDSRITVVADNGTEKTYQLSIQDNGIWKDAKLRESRMACDFLNYQSLYEITRLRSGQEADLAGVFVQTILPYVNFVATAYNGRTLSNAGEWWETIQRGVLLNNPIRSKPLPRPRKKSTPKLKAKFAAIKTKFDEGMQTLVDMINNSIDNIISELGYDFKAHLEYTGLDNIPIHSTEDVFKVKLTIKVGNTEIRRPQKFLNEAKLVALGMALRLVVLEDRLKGLGLQDGALRVVVLDDVMISLDMMNRKELMKYIKNHIINDSQVIILTHDEGLFKYIEEFFCIKDDAACPWVSLRVYPSVVLGTSKEKPVIVDERKEPSRVARHYIEAGDTTAAAIWLRKSYETLCLKNLPLELCLKTDGKVKAFIDLWEALCGYYNIDEKTNEAVREHTKFMFNIGAHANRLSLPIYQRELLDAWKILESIKKGLDDKCKVIEKETVLTFRHPNTNYTFCFEIEEDLWDAAASKRLKDIKCKILRWNYDGHKNYDYGDPTIPERLIGSTPKFERMLAGLIGCEQLNINEKMFLDFTFVYGRKLSWLLGKNNLSWN